MGETLINKGEGGRREAVGRRLLSVVGGES